MFVLTPPVASDQAARAAAWLRGHGLSDGDRVALVAGSDPRTVPFVWGALRAGIVPVPVNAHLHSEERDAIVSDAEVALTVGDEDWPDLDDGPQAELAPVPLARAMHYTSGTTGRAKGVWSGILSAADAQALFDDEQELWDPRPGETYLVCSPLYHSAPLRISMAALAAGARVLVYERFDAAEIARAFVDERINGAFLVPTHLRRLIAEGVEAPFARRILHAAEPCPEPLKRRAIEVFGADNLSEFYGSTEGQFTWCSSHDWLERPGTVGRARTGRTLSIDDPDGTGVGTIWNRVPSFARWVYWNDSDKTAAAWRDDAFSVGDLGRMDEDGFLYFEGRREDLIISGGVNVYPAEVERVLLGHPGVVDVAVFGVTDEQWGQRVCAAVVGDVAGDELLDWARPLLAGAQLPKEVRRVEDLPRTATGKVLRSKLIG